MAVINCLYINLYKSRKLTGKYVRSLVTMLIIAIVLDALVILLKLDYVYLAVATVVAYYIWLVLGSFDFPELTITIKDYLYFATYFITYFFLYAASVLIVSLDNFDFTSNFTAVAATLNNIGPGLGAVGPTCNFGGFSILSKLVLMFDMLAGRLELFPMLLLFSPSTWKKIYKALEKI